MRLMRATCAVVVLAGASLFLALGCGGDDGPTGPTIENNRLMMQFYNAPPLPSPWMYRASVLNGGQWVDGGTFNVDLGGNLVNAQGQPIDDNTLNFGTLDLLTCDSLRITFAESGAGMLFLAAAIDSNVSVRLESPMKEEVGARDLYYTYGTPSDAFDDNELSGIWFADVDGQSPSLDSLPDLPAGWIFEGWANHGGVYLSTGKFSGKAGADQNCRYYNCSASTPAFPGEDFLVNPPAGIQFPFEFDEGDSVVISIEPEDDPDSGLPFIRWHFRHIDRTSAELLEQLEQTHFISANVSPYWPAANAFITSD